jgi:hypothetical protein
MKKTKLALALSTMICASIVIGLSACNSNGTKEKSMDDTPMNMGSVSMSSPASDLKTAMRQLWEEHVTWTRNVIICLVDDAPGTDQAVKRLLKNQDDIGNAIKSYYGDAAGKQLTDLLYPHIKISAEVVKAARAGNAGALDEANKRWYANADEISAFLSKANPNWKFADMKLMMNDHLKLTTDEAVARIKKDYDADVKAYDAVHIEILKMADMLSEGIVMQFPEKFKSNTTK